MKVPVSRFVTEKIWDAFNNHSIPIYYGDETIANLFNSKAFVNMHSFDTWQQAADYVKWLDQNDDVYLEMLRQPPFAPNFDLAGFYHEMEKFLVHIVQQEAKQALRRPTCFMPAQMNDYFALLKPYAQKLDKAEQRAFRWRNRWYWGTKLLHHWLPGLIAEPNPNLLDFYHSRHERAVQKE